MSEEENTEEPQEETPEETTEPENEGSEETTDEPESSEEEPTEEPEEEPEASDEEGEDDAEEDDSEESEEDSEDDSDDEEESAYPKTWKWLGIQVQGQTAQNRRGKPQTLNWYVNLTDRNTFTIDLNLAEQHDTAREALEDVLETAADALGRVVED